MVIFTQTKLIWASFFSTSRNIWWKWRRWKYYMYHFQSLSCLCKWVNLRFTIQESKHEIESDLDLDQIRGKTSCSWNSHCTHADSKENIWVYMLSWVDRSSFPRFPYCSRETLKANKNHSSLIQWVKQSKNHLSFKDWSQWWSLKKQKNRFCLVLLHIICRHKSRICHGLLNCTTNESMGFTYMNSTRWEQLDSRLLE